ncbi:MAG TPA: hypothetical protein DCS07_09150 [Bdellovibrionales bacterium]|nr:hypothetical protein [Bdellovibrionales bacterium]
MILLREKRQACLSGLIFFLVSACLLQAETAHAKRKRFIFVNGGYSPLMNADMHEQDLLSFHHDLFEGKTVLLNAAGKNVQVVRTDRRGYPLRDASGGILLGPSQVGDQKAARPEVLRTEFESAAKDKIKELTIVYGDHGGRSGVPFWGGEFFDAARLRVLRSPLSSKTLIRSIHLHCYPGVAIVDGKRKIPENPAEWAKYLEAHYPENTCALGMGNGQEIGQYYSQGQKWPDTNWSKLLKNLKKPSLDRIQTALSEDASVRPIPKMTSDYLEDDFGAYLCKTAATASKKSEACSDCKGEMLAAVEKGPLILPEICTSEAFLVLQKAEAEVAVADQLYTEFRVMKTNWAVDWFYEHEPELHISHRASLERVDKIKATYAALGQLSDAQKAEMEKKIRDELGDKGERWDKLFYGLIANDFHPEFMKFLGTVDRKWLAANAEVYPAMAANPEIVFSGSACSVTKLGNHLYWVLARAQEARRKIASQTRKERKEAYEQQMALLPGSLKDVRKRYENIRHCEESKIR